MKTNQFGRSMVEMLGVLAIIGVLSIGAIAGYSKAMNKYKINKFTDQLSLIIATIKTEFSGRVSNSPFTELEYLKKKAIPDNMRDKDGNFVHFWESGPYSMSINFAANESPGEWGPAHTTVYDAFHITMSYLPEDVCVAILTADWGADLVGIGTQSCGGCPYANFYTNTTASENYAKTGDKDYPTPFTVERAQKACAPIEGSSKNNKNVGMLFKF